MTGIVMTLRGIRRDWRTGGLPVIALALSVAVCAVTSVGVFNERVQQAMQSRAAQTLGADLVIQSHNAIPPEVAQKALSLGLEVSQQVEFPSMILTRAGTTRLVSVKAVDQHYPLRGSARTAKRPYGDAEVAGTIPGRGEIWAHSRLFSEVEIDVGATIQLGEQTFRVARALILEPDGFSSFFHMAAPRVMM